MAAYPLVIENIEKTFPLEIKCPECGGVMMRDEDQFSLLRAIVRDKCKNDLNVTGEKFLFYYHPSIKYKCSCGYVTEANRHGLVYK